MQFSEHYEGDALFFFGDRPDALALYHALFTRMEEAFPAASVKVQKSQISFYGSHLFAMVSLPRRKAERGLVVSFGLPSKLASPRVAFAAEAYPGRWTHHVAVTQQAQLDDTLMNWLRQAYTFSEGKRRTT